MKRNNIFSYSFLGALQASPSVLSHFLPIHWHTQLKVFNFTNNYIILCNPPEGRINMSRCRHEWKQCLTASSNYKSLLRFTMSSSRCSLVISYAVNNYIYSKLTRSLSGSFWCVTKSTSIFNNKFMKECR